jgi:hypothetical protein
MAVGVLVDQKAEEQKAKSRGQVGRNKPLRITANPSIV